METGEFNREWDHFGLMCLMLQLSLLAASLVVGVLIEQLLIPAGAVAGWLICRWPRVLLPVAGLAAGVIGTLLPFYVTPSMALVAGLIVGAICYQVHLWHRERYTRRQLGRHVDQHRWIPVVHRPGKTVNLANSVGRARFRG